MSASNAIYNTSFDVNESFNPRRAEMSSSFVQSTTMLVPVTPSSSRRLPTSQLLYSIGCSPSRALVKLSSNRGGDEDGVLALAGVERKGEYGMQFVTDSCDWFSPSEGNEMASENLVRFISLWSSSLEHFRLRITLKEKALLVSACTSPNRTGSSSSSATSDGIGVIGQVTVEKHGEISVEEPSCSKLPGLHRSHFSAWGLWHRGERS